MPSDPSSIKKRTQRKSPKKTDVAKELFAGLAATRLFPVDLQPISAASSSSKTASPNGGRKIKAPKPARSQ